MFPSQGETNAHKKGGREVEREVGREGDWCLRWVGDDHDVILQVDGVTDGRISLIS